METPILLFISKESATYHYVRRQVESACSQGAPGTRPPTVRIIDIAEQPAMAERYNIEALPTIVIGNRRYVGAATAEALTACMGVVGAPEPLQKAGETADIRPPVAGKSPKKR